MKTRKHSELTPMESNQLDEFWRARNAYLKARQHSDLHFADNKLTAWISQCDTVPQLLQPFGFARYQSRQHFHCLEKWETFGRTKIFSAATVDEVREIAHYSPVGLKNLAWTVEETFLLLK